ncbi:MAG: hypothetical protein UR93_C0009G0036 [Berkelbacteria bacterium GW2011_GWA2_35_9]|uniref:tRNA-guanine(15) transglycosylase-like domain-containing protein n=1 Tax=Berkelbacteria bacterium GW2011_GWA2_35_9 TaxID=1618333 RepID=A0A0G0D660_9BACT|nr:MAG: hypothetical protein UR93_C0009G0036 [Berkelbacteria bacterium GW2011_GWA2_35_9]
MLMKKKFFTVLKNDKKTIARIGKLSTDHGDIDTPFFSVVGTSATVRTLSSEEILETDTQLVLANTYHLHLRPNEKVIKKLGGLSKFMNLNLPTMTDSGGFQAMSLGAGREHGIGKIGFFPNGKKLENTEDRSLVNITESGIEFRSHHDGSRHFFSPEISMQIQSDLGADIIFAFDECTSPLHNFEYTKKSMERTHRWAVRSLESYNKKQKIYGIIQGGVFKDLRLISAKFIDKLNFDGIAIGGALGDTKDSKNEITEYIVSNLSNKKPRHMLGIGDVDDIFEAVERGIDSLDCVWFTRLARRNMYFIYPEDGGNKINRWRKNIRSVKLILENPLSEYCKCNICSNYSATYIKHLVVANEMLGMRLITYHNIFFVNNLMKQIRESIQNSKFLELKSYWYGK